MKESDQILEFIAQNHRQLSETATKMYRECGRGALRVEFPRIPPNATLVGVAQTTYTKQEELHRLFPASTDDISGDAHDGRHV